MDKRYQVFVSSTFTDLESERRAVFQTLMEMDCIPSGMELFPAADEEQFKFITKIIDDSDYYIVIIGARYGSLTSTGLSYTEREFDYATSIGLKVIALIHSNPDSIASGKTDKNPELAAKLELFKKKLQEGRLVKFWDSSESLAGLVALSLSKTIKMYPAVGWVRANKVASSEILAESNTLIRENEQLRDKIDDLSRQNQAPEPNLAGLDDETEIRGEFKPQNRSPQAWSRRLTWGELFSYIAPLLLSHPNDVKVKFKIRDALMGDAGLPSVTVNDQDFDKVKIQLLALGLISVQYAGSTNGGSALFWSLTPKGRKTMLEIGTEKRG